MNLFNRKNKLQDEMKQDFKQCIEPLKNQLRLIRSDVVLGKISKYQELEMCQPILQKIEAFELKYGLH